MRIDTKRRAGLWVYERANTHNTICIGTQPEDIFRKCSMHIFQVMVNEMSIWLIRMKCSRLQVWTLNRNTKAILMSRAHNMDYGLSHDIAAMRSYALQLRRRLHRYLKMRKENQPNGWRHNGSDDRSVHIPSDVYNLISTMAVTDKVLNRMFLQCPYGQCRKSMQSDGQHSHTTIEHIQYDDDVLACTFMQYSHSRLWSHSVRICFGA